MLTNIVYLFWVWIGYGLLAISYTLSLDTVWLLYDYPFLTMPLHIASIPIARMYLQPMISIHLTTVVGRVPSAYCWGLSNFRGSAALATGRGYVTNHEWADKTMVTDWEGAEVEEKLTGSCDWETLAVRMDAKNNCETTRVGARGQMLMFDDKRCHEVTSAIVR
jgi:hypothetical protein